MSDGSEIRPSYSCSVSISSDFMMKREYDTITTRTPIRQWKRVNAELRGTVLLIKTVPSRPHRLYNKIRDRICGSDITAKRHPVKAYTMQGAEAGIATDYGKQPFVIRIRAEAEQFLLSADTLKTMLSWLECLSAAIDISLPLELRRMPRNRTLPRPAGRGAANEGREAYAAGSTTASPMAWSPVGGNNIQPSTNWSPVPARNEGQQLSFNPFSFGLPQITGFNNTNFQSAGFGSTGFNSTGFQSSGFQSSARSAALPILSPPPPPTPVPAPASAPRSQCPCSNCGTTRVPIRRTFVDQSQRISTLSTDTAETSYSMAASIEIDESGNMVGAGDGKWSPPKFSATKAAQMDYEKRCAKVICYGSPRRNDWYIKDGQKVHIDRGAVSRAVTLQRV